MTEELNEETCGPDGRPDNEMEKPKYEEAQEKHANHTLHKGNRLKISIEEYSSGMEDDVLTLTTQETCQQKLVYIINLEKDS